MIGALALLVAQAAAQRRKEDLTFGEWFLKHII